MKNGRFQRLRKPQPSARVAMITFLRANFQVATRDQRLTWFNTADREEFEILLDQLFTQAHYDYDARNRLEEMVAKIRQHVLSLTQAPQPEPRE